MLNSFSGIGRLSADPKSIPQTVGVTATFTIGINEFYKKDNELQKKTHWIPCVCFGRLAEISVEFLTKGSQVGIRGPLNTGSDGELRVQLLELEFLSSKQD